MFITVLIWLLILLCTVKTIGYGIYTFKKKNIAGGISLIILSILTAAAAWVFI